MRLIRSFFWQATSLVALFTFCHSLRAAEPPSYSGIYPSLAMSNGEGECGTGAVVPWAGRLWAITYGPHCPTGSSDKLYEITPALEQIVHPKSVGGTPANRMIHRESQQLFIGPYAIDKDRQVRVIPPATMPGRLTGNARHLTDPANKIYYATMEEGFYEVDVHTLAVKELFPDANGQPDHGGNLLPGYHGKGLFSGQGRLVYANNGERTPKATVDPTTTSGVLAEWNGPGANWQVIRRNQFTEVTGPGGIEGNPKPGTDPIWSIGWDFRSLILMLLDSGTWHTYRLPKSSHSYDGAHGWNTEWPRIREIGEPDLLMTMHGAFWKFPRTFSVAHSAGIIPRSNYLKVIGDFTLWNDRLVCGTDDTAKSEFLNKRKLKGNLPAPLRSQSNLWFLDPATLDHLGPVIGRGAVWFRDAVDANQPSDSYLLGGYKYRGVHLAHELSDPVKFTFEIDREGNGQWSEYSTESVPAHGSLWVDLGEAKGTWIRIRTDKACPSVTAFFHYRNPDDRPAQADPLFAGIAKEKASASRGLLHTGSSELRYLTETSGSAVCYELTNTPDGLALKPTSNRATCDWMVKNVALPTPAITSDAASLIYTDGSTRWRLPRGNEQQEVTPDNRLCREVCTERDLVNAGGIFYELPAENAGGFVKIRPIATHNRSISDYASFRGLLVLAGIDLSSPPASNIIRSGDGKAALWVGAVDDLWRFGKPRGVGGPWKETAVEAGVPSDPFLMTGFDKKTVTLAHSGQGTVRITLELDVSGDGLWKPFKGFDVSAGKPVSFSFPPALGAYWIRAVADQSTTATVQFHYE